MPPEPQTGAGVFGPAESLQPRTGLVTLLFTDTVGSTALKQRLGDLGGEALFHRHHQLVRDTLSSFPTGQEIETAGDSFLTVFSAPSDAVRFGLLLQVRLRRLREELGVPISDRVGIHVGEVVLRSEEGKAKPRELYGIQIDICARVMSLAQGGQVLMSRGVFDNARQVLKGEETDGLGPLSWLNHGLYQLKGVEEPVEICEVGETDLAPLAAPVDSEKAHRFELTEGEPVLGWRPAVGQPVPNTNWLLEAKLGEGGFGEVWLGRHPTMKTERRVFKFCFRADRVRTLKREMTLFRLLKERVGEHPNIVSLRDVYFEAPPYYVEEEYVAGKDLRAWMAGQERERRGEREDRESGARETWETGSVPLAVKLEIVAQVADALQAAHDAGIIHRDVKPANILIAQCGTRHAASDSRPLTADLRPPGLVAKLTDFGIGQVVSEECLRGVTRAGFTQTLLSSSSSQTGTQMYMAPELLAGKPASTRSDIYSLGVVLYQFLVEDFTQALTIDWAERIPDALLREDLEHCLSGEPQARFAGAAQLADSLRRHDQRKTERAERERLAAQALRRRRAARVAVAMAGILLLISLGLGYGLNKARRDRDWAELQAYVADTKLADSAYQSGNLGQAINLLRRHIPAPGAKDLRGIEWRYLWQRCQGEQVAVFQHDREVNCADISPDGRWVVTHCQDQFLIWDREHPEQSKRLASGVWQSKEPAQAAGKQMIAFSPAGGLLATATENEIAVWETATWEQVKVLSARAAVVAFSGNGSVLAAFGSDGVQTWRTSSWRQEVQPGELEVREGDGDRAVALNQDGTVLAACLDIWDNNVERRRDDLAVWRLPQRALVFRGRGAVIGPRALAISGDDQRLAVGGRLGSVHVWELGSNQKAKPFVGHKGLVQGLTFTGSRQGQNLVSAGSDQSLLFWAPDQAQPPAKLRGHRAEILSLRSSGDGRWVVTASKDNTARVWHGSGRPEMLYAASSIPRDRLMHALSPYGRHLLATNPAEWSFEEWDLTSGRRVRRTPMQATNLLWGLAHLAGPGAATQSLERNTFVLDWLRLYKAPEQAEPGRVGALYAYPPPWALIAGTFDGTVLAWGHETGALVYSNRLGSGPVMVGPKSSALERIGAVEMLPGNRWRGFAWDVAKNRRLPFQIDQAFENFGSSAFTPDGSLSVSPSADGWFHISDSAHGTRKSRIPASTNWQMVALSPDKKLLAVTYGDAVARIWDLRTYKPVTSPLVGHCAGVTKVGFSGDGRTLITYSWDQTARFWNVATGREILSNVPLNSFLGYHPWIHILSADNNAVLEPEGEDKVRFVPLPTLAQIDAVEMAADVQRKARPSADTLALRRE